MPWRIHHPGTSDVVVVDDAAAVISGDGVRLVAARQVAHRGERCGGMPSRFSWGAVEQAGVPHTPCPFG
ncbi:MAG: hypothetical protein IPN45_08225 [Actinomycetales bacterium]|nr:hypothetical protein [Actinomycetales bacterium]